MEVRLWLSCIPFIADTTGTHHDERRHAGAEDV